MQNVGQAVDRDGLQARIAEDYLIERLAGRVAVVRRLHVQGQHLPQLGQLLEEGHGLGLADASRSLESGLGIAPCRPWPFRDAGPGQSAPSTCRAAGRSESPT